MEDTGKEALKMEAFGVVSYNRPYICKECGGIMVFKGCGEYACENCRAKDYDDYGKYGIISSIIRGQMRRRSN